jgi:cyclic di-GMP phosphodiesterase
MRQSNIVVASGSQKVGRRVERILVEDGYQHVQYVGTGAEVVALCGSTKVDLLLLDIALHDMDGFAVLGQLEPAGGTGRLQVIIVADQRSEALRYRALALGARDFIDAPIDPTEVRLRVRNVLWTNTLETELVARNSQLAETVSTRSQELTRARREVLHHLAMAAEFRDDSTKEHTDRVGRTSALIAEDYGFSPGDVEMIKLSAPLHDVGKIGIPDSILLKPGKLSKSEIGVMRSHAQIGTEILSRSEVPELRLGETIALNHHERWDGGGYPNGLAGAAIPLAARIVSIADVFDALVHERPYKPAWSIKDAVAEIASPRGDQFDPQLVDIFLQLDHAALLDPVGAARFEAHRRLVPPVGRWEAGRQPLESPLGPPPLMVA